MECGFTLFCLVPLGNVQQQGVEGFLGGPAVVLPPQEFLQVGRHQACREPLAA